MQKPITCSIHTAAFAGGVAALENGDDPQASVPDPFFETQKFDLETLEFFFVPFGVSWLDGEVVPAAAGSFSVFSSFSSTWVE